MYDKLIFYYLSMHNVESNTYKWLKIKFKGKRKTFRVQSEELYICGKYSERNLVLILSLIIKQK